MDVRHLDESSLLEEREMISSPSTSALGSVTESAEISPLRLDNENADKVLLIEVVDDRFPPMGEGDNDDLGMEDDDQIKIIRRFQAHGDGSKRVLLSEFMENMGGEDAGWCLKSETQLREALGDLIHDLSDPESLRGTKRAALFSQYQPEACAAALALSCMGIRTTVINPSARGLCSRVGPLLLGHQDDCDQPIG